MNKWEEGVSRLIDAKKSEDEVLGVVSAIKAEFVWELPGKVEVSLCYSLDDYPYLELRDHSRAFSGTISPIIYLKIEDVEKLYEILGSLLSSKDNASA